MFINFGFAEYEEEKEVTQQIERKQSPPARGRGLKPVIVSAYTQRTVSPPARGRGLKQNPLLSLLGIRSRELTIVRLWLRRLLARQAELDKIL